jgi:hypothetical protein
LPPGILVERFLQNADPRRGVEADVRVFHPAVAGFAGRRPPEP